MNTQNAIAAVVALGTGIACAIAAFALWDDGWVALGVGCLSAAVVRGAQDLASRPATSLAAAAPIVTAALAAGAGIWSLGASSSPWLALFASALVAVLAGAALGILAWLIRPYPVDIDAVIGSGSADILRRYRTAAAWLRFSAWVKARSGSSLIERRSRDGDAQTVGGTQR